MDSDRNRELSPDRNSESDSNGNGDLTNTERSDSLLPDKTALAGKPTLYTRNNKESTVELITEESESANPTMDSTRNNVETEIYSESSHTAEDSHRNPAAGFTRSTLFDINELHEELGRVHSKLSNERLCKQAAKKRVQTLADNNLSLQHAVETNNNRTSNLERQLQETIQQCDEEREIHENTIQAAVENATNQQKLRAYQMIRQKYDENKHFSSQLSEAQKEIRKLKEYVKRALTTSDSSDINSEVPTAVLTATIVDPTMENTPIRGKPVIAPKIENLTITSIAPCSPTPAPNALLRPHFPTVFPTPGNVHTVRATVPTTISVLRLPTITGSGNVEVLPHTAVGPIPPAPRSEPKAQPCAEIASEPGMISQSLGVCVNRENYFQSVLDPSPKAPEVIPEPQYGPVEFSQARIRELEQQLIGRAPPTSPNSVPEAIGNQRIAGAPNRQLPGMEKSRPSQQSERNGPGPATGPGVPFLEENKLGQEVIDEWNKNSLTYLQQMYQFNVAANQAREQQQQAAERLAEYNRNNRRSYLLQTLARAPQVELDSAYQQPTKFPTGMYGPTGVLHDTSAARQAALLGLTQHPSGNLDECIYQSASHYQTAGAPAPTAPVPEPPAPTVLGNQLQTAQGMQPMYGGAIGRQYRGGGGPDNNDNHPRRPPRDPGGPGPPGEPPPPGPPDQGQRTIRDNAQQTQLPHMMFGPVPYVQAARSSTNLQSEIQNTGRSLPSDKVGAIFQGQKMLSFNPDKPKVEKWLYQYEMYLEMLQCFNEEDRLAKLVFLLTENCFDFIENQPQTNLASYNAMKEAVIEKYGDQHLPEEKYRELENIKQGDRKVDAYFEELENKLRKVFPEKLYGTLDPFVITIFERGMEQGLYDQFKYRCSLMHPKSIHQMKQIAISCEQLLRDKRYQKDSHPYRPQVSKVEDQRPKYPNKPVNVKMLQHTTTAEKGNEAQEVYELVRQGMENVGLSNQETYFSALGLSDTSHNPRPPDFPELSDEEYWKKFRNAADFLVLESRRTPESKDSTLVCSQPYYGIRTIGPVIKVKVNIYGKEIQAIVDTGSQPSVANGKFTVFLSEGALLQDPYSQVIFDAKLDVIGWDEKCRQLSFAAFPTVTVSGKTAKICVFIDPHARHNLVLGTAALAVLPFQLINEVDGITYIPKSVRFKFPTREQETQTDTNHSQSLSPSIYPLSLSPPRTFTKKRKSNSDIEVPTFDPELDNSPKANSCLQHIYDRNNSDSDKIMLTVSQANYQRAKPNANSSKTKSQPMPVGFEWLTNDLDSDIEDESSEKEGGKQDTPIKRRQVIMHKFSKPVEIRLLQARKCNPQTSTLCHVKLDKEKVTPGLELEFTPNLEVLTKYGLSAPNAVIKIDNDNCALVVLDNTNPCTAPRIPARENIGEISPCKITDPNEQLIAEIKDLSPQKQRRNVIVKRRLKAKFKETIPLIMTIEVDDTDDTPWTPEERKGKFRTVLDLSHLPTDKKDDILKNAENYGKHKEVLGKVLCRLEEVNLKLNPKKCSWFQDKIVYMGFELNTNGMHTDTKKIQALKDWQIPTDLWTLRCFLGFASYYRRYIHNFAKVATPLYRLLKNDVEWEWYNNCKLALKLLCICLITAPVLRYPDFANFIETYASKEAIAAVLAQKDQKGRLHPIGYVSRTIRPYEKSYTATELQCLVLVYGLKQFRCYLYQHQVTVITDYGALTHLQSATSLPAHLQHWALTIQEIDPKIVYRKGKCIANADSLSRNYAEQSGATDWTEEDELMLTERLEEDPMQVHLIEIENEIPELHATNRTETPLQQRARNEQLTDPFLTAMIAYHVNTILPPDNDLAQTVNLQEDNFILINEVLYYDYHKNEQNGVRPLPIAVPRQLREMILEEQHDAINSGHFSYSKLWRRVKTQFWWPNLRGDLKVWVRSCSRRAFKRGNSLQHLAPLQSIPTPPKPWTLCAAALQTLPLTEFESRHVLVVVDHCTKYVVTEILDNKSSNTVAEKFAKIISHMGNMAILLTDRETEFVGKPFQDLLKSYDIEHHMITPYHPRGNGLAEKMVSTITAMLSKIVNRNTTNWDKMLDKVIWAYNRAPQESTGMNPFSLMFARDPNMVSATAIGKLQPQRLPVDSDYLSDSLLIKHYLDQAVESADKTKTRQVADHGRRYHSQPNRFNVGDHVLLHTRHGKLEATDIDPYIINALIGDNAYLVKLGPPDDAPQRIHTERLSKCYPELGDVSFLGGRRESVPSVRTLPGAKPGETPILPPIQTQSIQDAELSENPDFDTELIDALEFSDIKIVNLDCLPTKPDLPSFYEVENLDENFAPFAEINSLNAVIAPQVRCGTGDTDIIDHYSTTIVFVLRCANDSLIFAHSIDNSPIIQLISSDIGRTISVNSHLNKMSTPRRPISSFIQNDNNLLPTMANDTNTNTCRQLPFTELRNLTLDNIGARTDRSRVTRYQLTPERNESARHSHIADVQQNSPRPESSLAPTLGDPPPTPDLAELHKLEYFLRKATEAKAAANDKVTSSDIPFEPLAEEQDESPHLGESTEVAEARADCQLKQIQSIMRKSQQRENYSVTFAAADSSKTIPQQMACPIENDLETPHQVVNSDNMPKQTLHGRFTKKEAVPINFPKAELERVVVTKQLAS